MSAVTSIGAAPPVAPLGLSAAGENRTPFASGQRGPRAESAPSVDQTKLPVVEAAADLEKSRAKPVRDQIELSGSGQLAAKSGYVEGSFEPFIDIIDPRYQTRSARVFGPEGAAPTAETAPALVPRTVSKAYEAINGSGKAAFAKTV
jgi:hypothetical protein